MFQRPRLFTPKERAKLANSEGAVAKLSLAQPSSLSPHDAPSELLVFATPTNLFGLLVVLGSDRPPIRKLRRKTTVACASWSSGLY